MKKRLLLLLLASFSTSLLAQDPAFCAEMLSKARQALLARQYGPARDYCESALTLCPEQGGTAQAVLDSVNGAVEQETRVAKARGLAFIAKSLVETDQTKALRVAQEAYEIYPLTEAKQVMSETMSKVFYDEDAYVYQNLQHSGSISSAIFSPDGQLILTDSYDNTAKLWNLKGELLADLNEHGGYVYSAVFSPDGQLILTAGDSTAKLWNLKGELLADMSKHGDWVISAIFSPDNYYMLTASIDHTAKLWPTPQTIYDWLCTDPIAPLSAEEKRQYGIE